MIISFLNMNDECSGCFFVISKQNLLTSDIDLCFFMCERVDRLRGARRAYHQFLCKYRSTSMYIYLHVYANIFVQIYIYRVSLKNALFRDWHPLRPQDYSQGWRSFQNAIKYFLLVRRTHLPIFRPLMDGFPQMVFPKLKEAVITRSKWQMAQNVPTEKALYFKLSQQVHTLDFMELFNN